MTAAQVMGLVNLLPDKASKIAWFNSLDHVGKRLVLYGVGVRDINEQNKLIDWAAAGGGQPPPSPPGQPRPMPDPWNPPEPVKSILCVYALMDQHFVRNYADDVQYFMDRGMTGIHVVLDLSPQGRTIEGVEGGYWRNDPVLNYPVWGNTIHPVVLDNLRWLSERLLVTVFLGSGWAAEHGQPLGSLKGNPANEFNYYTSEHTDILIELAQTLYNEQLWGHIFRFGFYLESSHTRADRASERIARALKDMGWERGFIYNDIDGHFTLSDQIQHELGIIYAPSLNDVGGRFDIDMWRGPIGNCDGFEVGGDRSRIQKATDPRWPLESVVWSSPGLSFYRKRQRPLKWNRAIADHARW